MHTNSPYRLAAPEPRALGLGIAGTTLRAVAVAAALACSAGASLAGDASVKVTSFTVSAAEFSGNFAFAMDPFQSYNMSALEAGCGADRELLRRELESRPEPRRANREHERHRQHSELHRCGDTVDDGGLQLVGPGHSGTFAACTAELRQRDCRPVRHLRAFERRRRPRRRHDHVRPLLRHERLRAGQLGGTYSQTALNLLLSSDASDDKSFADGLLSNNLAGGTGATSGHFSWTYTLAAGEAAYYALSGSAIASAELAAPIPEPETYALMLLGLAGIGTVARRRRAKAEADAAAA